MKTFPSFRLSTFALVVACCAVFCGCGITKSKNEADAVLTRHFETISTNGFTTALSDYGGGFFQNTTKEEWSKVLARFISKVGTYRSHTIVGWRSFSNYGGAGSGTRVSLQCQVVYSKRAVQETFTLFKGVTDSDYKIIGHQIDAAALLQD
jgi:hypothetical protein